MSKKTTKRMTLKDRDVSAKKAKEIKGAHSGGANFAFGDGSVRFVSAGIDLNARLTDITDGTSNTLKK